MRERPFASVQPDDAAYAALLALDCRPSANFNIASLNTLVATGGARNARLAGGGTCRAARHRPAIHPQRRVVVSDTDAEASYDAGSRHGIGEGLP
jgi:hypothetical protein